MIIEKIRTALGKWGFASASLAIRDASEVIGELRKGNLRARARVRKLDTAGRFLLFVNEMAESLESSVEKNKILERAKTTWLQELAHDIRTPLASIELAQTTLKDSNDRLSQAQKIELIDDSLREVIHVRSLVDDLLFLSLLEDSSYFTAQEEIDAVLYLRSFAAPYVDRARRLSKTLHFVSSVSESGCRIKVNKTLLERLCRNCIENALAYAKSEVSVELSYDRERKLLVLCFKNNADPMAPEQIKSFGKTRTASRTARDPSLPVSLGIGSMIISRAAAYLGAELEVMNLSGPENQEIGVSIQLCFKA